MGIIKKFAPLQKLWYITYDEGDQGSPNWRITNVTNH